MKRNDAKRQSALDFEAVLKERLKIAEADETAAADSPEGFFDLGHAGLGGECWSGIATPRRRDPARSPSVLHRSRPLQRAETRSTPNGYEFLTD